MTEFALYEDLAKYFRDGMVTAGYVMGTTLLIDWPDVKLDIPVLSGDATNGHAKPWIRYNYRPVAAGQATLGSRFFTNGVIIHQIFTAPYQGLESALSIADSVRSVYDGKVSVGGVWFRNTRPQVVGLTGGWFQANVSVNFEYEFTR